MIAHRDTAGLRLADTSRVPSRACRLMASPWLSPVERLAVQNAMLPARKVKAHTDLIRDGERAEYLFLVDEGWACRYATTRNGGRQFSALLVPGDIGNLDSLMFEELGYSMKALTDLMVIPIRREQGASLIVNHPGIAATFAWLAMVENLILGVWAVSLGRRSAKRRLAHLLCELSLRVDADASGKSIFPFPSTQDHLADALGLTSIHVNRMMRELREEGLIRLENRVMALPDIAGLRQLSGFDPGYLQIVANPAH